MNSTAINPPRATKSSSHETKGILEGARLKPAFGLSGIFSSITLAAVHFINCHPDRSHSFPKGMSRVVEGPRVPGDAHQLSRLQPLRSRPQPRPQIRQRQRRVPHPNVALFATLGWGFWR